MADSPRLPPPDVDLSVLCTTMLNAARAARIGVTVTHVDGGAPRNIYVSEVAAGIMGWSVDELMGADAMIHVAAEDRHRLRERFEKRGDETGQVTYELTAIRKDGSRTPIRITAADAIFDHRRSVVAFIVDLAARRAAEEARLHAEARFRDLIEKAPEPIAIFDKVHFLYANPAFASVLGYPCVDDLYPVPLTQIVHSKDLALMERRTQMLIDHARQPPPYVYTCLRRDGSLRLLEATSVPFQYEGKPTILTMGRDVTEKRMLEAKLIQTDRLAALGTLAAGVAHEINNPLAYLMLNLDWIARKVSEGAPVGPQVAPGSHERGGGRSEGAVSNQGAEWITEMLREARRGAERVAAIVRHLRNFSRAEDDTRRAVDLAGVVHTAIKLAAHEIRPRARITTLVEPIRAVWANEGRLEQVVLNLLLNAAQALPEACVATNEIRVVVRPSPDGSAILEISDNGEGIASEVLPRIFDPFFTTKPPGVGTGLGLSICHGIVASLGGRITVDSVPGEGTTFRVVLPTTHLQDDETRAQSTAAEANEEERARVLVVDDEMQIASTLRELLAADHHEVLATTNASDAFAAVVAGSNFDVIFCALTMPGMDGITLFHEISKVRPGLEKRIVFMTAGAFTKPAADFLASVDNRHIEKPFSLGLVERIVVEMRRNRPVDERPSTRAAPASER